MRFDVCVFVSRNALSVVVNTRGTVLMLQFAEVQWDYSAVNDFYRQSYTSNGGLWSKGSSCKPKSSQPLLWSMHKVISFFKNT